MKLLGPADGGLRDNEGFRLILTTATITPEAAVEAVLEEMAAEAIAGATPTATEGETTAAEAMAEEGAMEAVAAAIEDLFCSRGTLK